MTNIKMPMIFIGHGSPMNAIENNQFTDQWRKIGQSLPKPKAVLVLSAHWFTEGVRIQTDENPKLIYDMYGFPKELYEIKYPAIGSPEIARRTIKLAGQEIAEDNSWGIDHGAWSILVHLLPDADIPVYQMSINRRYQSVEHYELGKRIAGLREEGVLILASGNVVHNLREVDWENPGGTGWAKEFDSYIKECVVSGDYRGAVNYRNHRYAHKAVPTSDHYDPLLYILGAADQRDRISLFNEECVLGSLSMTCYQFEQEFS